MALRLPEHWLWDFWLARDGDDVHLFYLQAPRALGDPELRHRNATIGHAVSRDLRRWRVLGDALGPGPPGAFDDLATWTGSVLRHDGRWWMFYTGVSHAEDPPVQRVGLATSSDLGTWERHGMVLEADPRWYGTEHWRDPWVAWDEAEGRFHMLVTAAAGARGVIGQAWSDDLRAWAVAPPLTEPGDLAQLEVPQLVHLGGAWRILFSATREDGVAHTGTHYLTAPYTEHGLLAAGYYAGRVVEHRGAWWFLGWRDLELSDPMAVSVAPDGGLAVA
jgi:beta-fructofuranosidase